ncbi:hypothetical protein IVB45_17310 [Bradyrhizobium sp. 4]|uniref:hypothetical protein n=1 Tax=unclassified Bradyrhizobium TaxID=2631580 RepID=UPI001FFA04B5|nr:MULTISPECIES: hypothetical protein [unclassified Bradyrhizobium]MCK1402066.1 hypothetical protein [Bradyrhizobium sp. 39]MCK1751214.1 hypothetical protein [Bradyrhizobium sp. 135]UPJ38470.1 hypothetical protein IVB45_17310 [Bradyrhizobium sp. 4]
MRCEAIEMTARPRTAGMACHVCGCTDDNACPGGCGWVSIDPPLCSACEPRAMVEDDAERPQLVLPANAGFFSAQYCPASRTPALHAPIFVDEDSGHCARCQEGFFL